MGIVFSHAVAASLYYIRYLTQSLSPQERNNVNRPLLEVNENKHDLADNVCECEISPHWSDISVSMDLPFTFTETLMPILDSTNLSELRDAVKMTFSRCVLNTSLIRVFLVDPLNNHMVDNAFHDIPKSEFISDVLSQRRKTFLTVPPNQDGIQELIGSHHIKESNTSVLLFPIPERGTVRSIGLVVVVSHSGSLASIDPQRVELCLKQISVTYEVVKFSHNKCNEPNVSNVLSLIQLCGELNDQDAPKLEVKLIRYLQQQTRAESGFLLLVVPETQMLFCQAVDDIVLQEEIRFAGPTSCFAEALETKQPITLDDIHPERRLEIEKIIRKKVHSLLCVPVCINDSKDLLALACLVNKCNWEKFNQDDINVTHQCFKYTATVLTSTLAFQNERKLKNQTQALLQVAKKLFTRLGPAVFRNVQKERDDAAVQSRKEKYGHDLSEVKAYDSQCGGDWKFRQPEVNTTQRQEPQKSSFLTGSKSIVSPPPVISPHSHNHHQCHWLPSMAEVSSANNICHVNACNTFVMVPLSTLCCNHHNHCSTQDSTLNHKKCNGSECSRGFHLTPDASQSKLVLHMTKGNNTDSSEEYLTPRTSPVKHQPSQFSNVHMKEHQTKINKLCSTAYNPLTEKTFHYSAPSISPRQVKGQEMVDQKMKTTNRNICTSVVKEVLSLPPVLNFDTHSTSDTKVDTDVPVSQDNCFSQIRDLKSQDANQQGTNEILHKLEVMGFFFENLDEFGDLFNFTGQSCSLYPELAVENWFAFQAAYTDISTAVVGAERGLFSDVNLPTAQYSVFKDIRDYKNLSTNVSSSDYVVDTRHASSCLSKIKNETNLDKAGKCWLESKLKDEALSTKNNDVKTCMYTSSTFNGRGISLASSDVPDIDISSLEDDNQLLSSIEFPCQHPKETVHEGEHLSKSSVCFYNTSFTKVTGCNTLDLGSLVVNKFDTPSGDHVCESSQLERPTLCRRNFAYPGSENQCDDKTRLEYLGPTLTDVSSFMSCDDQSYLSYQTGSERSQISSHIPKVDNLSDRNSFHSFSDEVEVNMVANPHSITNCARWQDIDNENSIINGGFTTEVQDNTVYWNASELRDNKMDCSNIKRYKTPVEGFLNNHEQVVSDFGKKAASLNPTFKTLSEKEYDDNTLSEKSNKTQSDAKVIDYYVKCECEDDFNSRKEKISNEFVFRSVCLQDMEDQYIEKIILSKQDEVVHSDKPSSVANEIVQDLYSQPHSLSGMCVHKDFPSKDLKFQPHWKHPVSEIEIDTKISYSLFENVSTSLGSVDLDNSQISTSSWLDLHFTHDIKPSILTCNMEDCSVQQSLVDITTASSCSEIVGVTSDHTCFSEMDKVALHCIVSDSETVGELHNFKPKHFTETEHVGYFSDLTGESGIYLDSGSIGEYHFHQNSVSAENDLGITVDSIKIFRQDVRLSDITAEKIVGRTLERGNIYEQNVYSSNLRIEKDLELSLLDETEKQLTSSLSISPLACVSGDMTEKTGSISVSHPSCDNSDKFTADKIPDLVNEERFSNDICQSGHVCDTYINLPGCPDRVTFFVRSDTESVEVKTAVIMDKINDHVDDVYVRPDVHETNAPQNHGVHSVLDMSSCDNMQDNLIQQKRTSESLRKVGFLASELAMSKFSHFCEPLLKVNQKQAIYACDSVEVNQEETVYISEPLHVYKEEALYTSEPLGVKEEEADCKYYSLEVNNMKAFYSKESLLDVNKEDTIYLHRSPLGVNQEKTIYPHKSPLEIVNQEIIYPQVSPLEVDKKETVYPHESPLEANQKAAICSHESPLEFDQRYTVYPLESPLEVNEEEIVCLHESPPEVIKKKIIYPYESTLEVNHPEIFYLKETQLNVNQEDNIYLCESPLEINKKETIYPHESPLEANPKEAICSYELPLEVDWEESFYPHESPLEVNQEEIICPHESPQEVNQVEIIYPNEIQLEVNQETVYPHESSLEMVNQETIYLQVSPLGIINQESIYPPKSPLKIVNHKIIYPHESPLEIANLEIVYPRISPLEIVNQEVIYPHESPLEVDNKGTVYSHESPLEANQKDSICSHESPLEFDQTYIVYPHDSPLEVNQEEIVCLHESPPEVIQQKIVYPYESQLEVNQVNIYLNETQLKVNQGDNIYLHESPLEANPKEIICLHESPLEVDPEKSFYPHESPQEVNQVEIIYLNEIQLEVSQKTVYPHESLLEIVNQETIYSPESPLIIVNHKIIYPIESPLEIINQEAIYSHESPLETVNQETIYLLESPLETANQEVIYPRKSPLEAKQKEAICSHESPLEFDKKCTVYPHESPLEVYQEEIVCFHEPPPEIIQEGIVYPYESPLEVNKVEIIYLNATQVKVNEEENIYPHVSPLEANPKEVICPHESPLEVAQEESFCPHEPLLKIVNREAFYTHESPLKIVNQDTIYSPELPLEIVNQKITYLHESLLEIVNDEVIRPHESQIESDHNETVYPDVSPLEPNQKEGICLHESLLEFDQKYTVYSHDSQLDVNHEEIICLHESPPEVIQEEIVYPHESSLEVDWEESFYSHVSQVEINQQEIVCPHDSPLEINQDFVYLHESPLEIVNQEAIFPHKSPLEIFHQKTIYAHKLPQEIVNQETIYPHKSPLEIVNQETIYPHKSPLEIVNQETIYPLESPLEVNLEKTICTCEPLEENQKIKYSCEPMKACQKKINPQLVSLGESQNLRTDMMEVKAYVNEQIFDIVFSSDAELKFLPTQSSCRNIEAADQVESMDSPTLVMEAPYTIIPHKQPKRNIPVVNTNLIKEEHKVTTEFINKYNNDKRLEGISLVVEDCVDNGFQFRQLNVYDKLSETTTDLRDNIVLIKTMAIDRGSEIFDEEKMKENGKTFNDVKSDQKLKELKNYEDRRTGGDVFIEKNEKTNGKEEMEHEKVFNREIFKQLMNKLDCEEEQDEHEEARTKKRMCKGGKIEVAEPETKDGNQNKKQDVALRKIDNLPDVKLCEERIQYQGHEICCQKLEDTKQKTYEGENKFDTFKLDRGKINDYLHQDVYEKEVEVDDKEEYQRDIKGQQQNIFKIEIADEGEVIFEREIESGGEVIFEREIGGGGEVIFEREIGGGGEVIFEREIESGGEVIFEREIEGGGGVIFEREIESGGEVIFEREIGGGGEVIFEREIESGGEVIFEREIGGGGEVIFEREIEGEGEVIFEREIEGGGGVIFEREIEGGGEVIFEKEIEGGGKVIFEREIENGREVLFEKDFDDDGLKIFERENEDGQNVFEKEIEDKGEETSEGEIKDKAHEIFDKEVEDEGKNISERVRGHTGQEVYERDIKEKQKTNRGSKKNVKDETLEREVDDKGQEVYEIEVKDEEQEAYAKDKAEKHKLYEREIEGDDQELFERETRDEEQELNDRDTGDEEQELNGREIGDEEQELNGREIGDEEQELNGREIEDEEQELYEREIKYEEQELYERETGDEEQELNDKEIEDEEQELNGREIEDEEQELNDREIGDEEQELNGREIEDEEQELNDREIEDEEQELNGRETGDEQELNGREIEDEEQELNGREIEDEEQKLYKRQIEDEEQELYEREIKYEEQELYERETGDEEQELNDRETGDEEQELNGREIEDEEQELNCREIGDEEQELNDRETGDEEQELNGREIEDEEQELNNREIEDEEQELNGRETGDEEQELNGREIGDEEQELYLRETRDEEQELYEREIEDEEQELNGREIGDEEQELYDREIEDEEQELNGREIGDEEQELYLRETRDEEQEVYEREIEDEEQELNGREIGDEEQELYDREIGHEEQELNGREIRDEEKELYVRETRDEEQELYEREIEDEEQELNGREIGDEEQELYDREIGHEEQELKDREIGDEEKELYVRETRDEEQELYEREIEDEEQELNGREIGDEEQELYDREIGDEEQELKDREIGDEEKELYVRETRDEEQELYEREIEDEEQELNGREIGDEEQELYDREIGDEEQELKDREIGDEEKELYVRETRDEEQELYEREIEDEEQELYEREIEDEQKLYKRQIEDEEQELYEREIKYKEQELYEREIEDEEQELYERKTRDEEQELYEGEIRDEELELCEKEMEAKEQMLCEKEIKQKLYERETESEEQELCEIETESEEQELHERETESEEQELCEREIESEEQELCERETESEEQELCEREIESEEQELCEREIESEEHYMYNKKIEMISPHIPEIFDTVHAELVLTIPGIKSARKCKTPERVCESQHIVQHDCDINVNVREADTLYGEKTDYHIVDVQNKYLTEVEKNTVVLDKCATSFEKSPDGELDMFSICLPKKDELSAVTVFNSDKSFLNTTACHVDILLQEERPATTQNTLRNITDGMSNSTSTSIEESDTLEHTLSANNLMSGDTNKLLSEAQVKESYQECETCLSLNKSQLEFVNSFTALPANSVQSYRKHTEVCDMITGMCEQNKMGKNFNLYLESGLLNLGANKKHRGNDFRGKPLMRSSVKTLHGCQAPSKKFVTQIKKKQHLSRTTRSNVARKYINSFIRIPETKNNEFSQETDLLTALLKVQSNLLIIKAASYLLHESDQPSTSKACNNYFEKAGKLANQFTFLKSEKKENSDNCYLDYTTTATESCDYYYLAGVCKTNLAEVCSTDVVEVNATKVLCNTEEFFYTDDIVISETEEACNTELYDIDVVNVNAAEKVCNTEELCDFDVIEADATKEVSNINVVDVNTTEKVCNTELCDFNVVEADATKEVSNTNVTEVDAAKEVNNTNVVQVVAFEEISNTNFAEIDAADEVSNTNVVEADAAEKANFTNVLEVYAAQKVYNIDEHCGTDRVEISDIDEFRDTDLIEARDNGLGYICDTDPVKVCGTDLAEFSDTNLTKVSDTYFIKFSNTVKICEAELIEVEGICAADMSKVCDTAQVCDAELVEIYDINLTKFCDTESLSICDTNLVKIEEICDTNLENKCDTGLKIVYDTSLAGICDTDVEDIFDSNVENVIDTNLKRDCDVHLARVCDSNLTELSDIIPENDCDADVAATSTALLLNLPSAYSCYETLKIQTDSEYVAVLSSRKCDCSFAMEDANGGLSVVSNDCSCLSDQKVNCLCTLDNADTFVINEVYGKSHLLNEPVVHLDKCTGEVTSNMEYQTTHTSEAKISDHSLNKNADDSLTYVFKPDLLIIKKGDAVNDSVGSALSGCQKFDITTSVINGSALEMTNVSSHLNDTDIKDEVQIKSYVTEIIQGNAAVEENNFEHTNLSDAHSKINPEKCRVLDKHFQSKFDITSTLYEEHDHMEVMFINEEQEINNTRSIVPVIKLETTIETDTGNYAATQKLNTVNTLFAEIDLEFSESQGPEGIQDTVVSYTVSPLMKMHNLGIEGRTRKTQMSMEQTVTGSGVHLPAIDAKRLVDVLPVVATECHFLDKSKTVVETGKDMEPSRIHLESVLSEKEMNFKSSESSLRDMTDFEESNLSSEDSAWDADISSFDSTILAPRSSERVTVRQPMKYHILATHRSIGSSVLDWKSVQPAFELTDSDKSQSEVYTSTVALASDQENYPVVIPDKVEIEDIEVFETCSQSRLLDVEEEARQKYFDVNVRGDVSVNIRTCNVTLERNDLIQQDRYSSFFRPQYAIDRSSTYESSPRVAVCSQMNDLDPWYSPVTFPMNDKDNTHSAVFSHPTISPSQFRIEQSQSTKSNKNISDSQKCDLIASPYCSPNMQININLQNEAGSSASSVPTEFNSLPLTSQLVQISDGPQPFFTEIVSSTPKLLDDLNTDFNTENPASVLYHVSHFPYKFMFEQVTEKQDSSDTISGHGNICQSLDTSKDEPLGGYDYSNISRIEMFSDRIIYGTDIEKTLSNSIMLNYSKSDNAESSYNYDETTLEESNLEFASMQLENVHERLSIKPSLDLTKKSRNFHLPCLTELNKEKQEGSKNTDDRIHKPLFLDDKHCNDIDHKFNHTMSFLETESNCESESTSLEINYEPFLANPKIFRSSKSVLSVISEESSESDEIQDPDNLDQQASSLKSDSPNLSTIVKGICEISSNNQECSFESNIDNEKSQCFSGFERETTFACDNISKIIHLNQIRKLCIQTSLSTNMENLVSRESTDFQADLHNAELGAEDMLSGHEDFNETFDLGQATIPINKISQSDFNRNIDKHCSTRSNIKVNDEDTKSEIDFESDEHEKLQVKVDICLQVGMSLHENNGCSHGKDVLRTGRQNIKFAEDVCSKGCEIFIEEGSSLEVNTQREFSCENHEQAFEPTIDQLLTIHDESQESISRIVPYKKHHLEIKNQRSETSNPPMTDDVYPHKGLLPCLKDVNFQGYQCKLCENLSKHKSLKFGKTHSGLSIMSQTNELLGERRRSLYDEWENESRFDDIKTNKTCLYNNMSVDDVSNADHNTQDSEVKELLDNLRGLDKQLVSFNTEETGNIYARKNDKDNIDNSDDDDDLNASSAAYSDSMEILEISDELFGGEDSGGSSSDLDILNHTSSTISDLSVLQGLVGQIACNLQHKHQIPVLEKKHQYGQTSDTNLFDIARPTAGGVFPLYKSNTADLKSSNVSWKSVDEIDICFLNEDLVLENTRSTNFSCASNDGANQYQQLEDNLPHVSDDTYYVKNKGVENYEGSDECYGINYIEDIHSSESIYCSEDKHILSVEKVDDINYSNIGAGYHSMNSCNKNICIGDINVKKECSDEGGQGWSGGVSDELYITDDNIFTYVNTNNNSENVSDIGDGASSLGLLGESDLCGPDDLFAVSSLSDSEVSIIMTDTYLPDCYSMLLGASCTSGLSGFKERYNSFFIGNCEPDSKFDPLIQNCSEWSSLYITNSNNNGMPNSDIDRVKEQTVEEDAGEINKSQIDTTCNSDVFNECILIDESYEEEYVYDTQELNGQSKNVSTFEDQWRQTCHNFSLTDLVNLFPLNTLHWQCGLRNDDLTKLLKEIMQEARNLTDAERCSVFLLDKDTDELVAMVFDGITAYDKEVQGEIRLPKTQGIAGHVATTGTLLNIRDAYSHPLFYRGIDDSTGFRTRNILCFPIKDEDGVVFGVAQLCNKKTFQYFTTFDEDVASAFAVYCCISISHSLMYKKVIDIQYRNSLANELMMFHMKSLMYKKLIDTQFRHHLANALLLYTPQKQVPIEEVKKMAETRIPPVTMFSLNFDSFDFPPRTISESQTVLSCLSMFEDLGFLSRWRIKLETLARFLLMVKKGYRNPPYHNWMHAYAVTHFCYLLIKNLHLHNYLEDIELLALFVSCLCHDIDHRGTTNSFQVQSQSVLAALYSSEGSVMERHHLAQSMCILNTEGSNLFENLSSREYQIVLDLMREIILATDLAHHLRSVKDQEQMAESGKYDKNSISDKHMLLCLLMTACDLSDQTKSWHHTKHIAALVYQEFFSQGDLEKALGKSPLEMMDRERAFIPELQISFLDNVALPVYRILAKMFPGAESPVKNVEDNRKHWVHIGQLLKLRHGSSTGAMSVEQIISIEEDEESSNGGQVNGR